LGEDTTITCPDNCSNQGTCGSDGKCTCNTGYSGDNCATKNSDGNGDGTIIPVCTTAADCNNHGTCTGGKCYCTTDYKGDTCFEQINKVCPGGGNCSGHGTCEPSTGECTCASGYEGTDCATAVSSCPN